MYDMGANDVPEMFMPMYDPDGRNGWAYGDSCEGNDGAASVGKDLQKKRPVSDC